MRNVVFLEFHSFLAEFSRKMFETNPQMTDVKKVLSFDGQSPKAIKYTKREPSLRKSPDDTILYDMLYFVTLLFTVRIYL